MNGWAGLKAPLLATFASIALFSCATGRDSSSNDIYYRSQKVADAALVAFDKANPSCQLWTNWQKMCSRTNPDGKPVCFSDNARPVAASVPFCVETVYADREAELILGNDRLTLGSVSRFCRSKSTLETEPQWANHTAIGFCTFRRGRPFTNLNFSSKFELPKNWSVVPLYQNSVDHGEDFGSLFDPAKSNWCNEFEFLGAPDNVQIGYDGGISLTAKKQDAEPVYGIFCKSLKQRSAIMNTCKESAKFDAVSFEEINTRFLSKNFKLVHDLDSEIISHRHEVFSQKGIYHLVGGRAPYEGKYSITGDILLSSIENGPSYFDNLRRRILKKNDMYVAVDQENDPCVVFKVIFELR